MTKQILFRTIIAIAIAAMVAVSFSDSETNAQRRRTAPKYLPVCGNPTLACKSDIVFQPYDLPFRLPRSAVIYESELFYAIILTSIKSPEDNCDVFVPESQRLEAQAMFPDHKVFSSRCVMPGEVSYSNTSPKAQFMALFAGTTLTDANRMLAAVKATGKFPAANIRRMRAVINGT
jgi:hypothetical protein